MEKSWVAALTILTLLSLVAEFSGGGDHGAVHWWNRIPGFFIFFGGLGCLILILFSRLLGKWFLLKDEDFYDDK